MRLPLVAGLGGAALALAIVALTVGIGGRVEPSGNAAPTMSSSAPGGSETAAPMGGPAAVRAGREVFAQMGCGSCHTLAAAGSTGDFGPSLDQRLPAHTRASLVARIMAGPGMVQDFAGMPTNFRERLTERQLDALVTFLLASRDR